MTVDSNTKLMTACFFNCRPLGNISYDSVLERTSCYTMTNQNVVIKLLPAGCVDCCNSYRHFNNFE